MKKLYSAPINVFGHYVYRHLLLLKGADYAFSELLMPNDFKENRKLKIFPEDLDKTIFQIGVNNTSELDFAVSELQRRFKVKEININMGCPHSSMQKNNVCSGILYDLNLMNELCSKLSSYGNFIPSVKLRLGTSKENIEIEKYLEICSKNNVNKVYIHARTLKYNYTKKAMIDEVKHLKEKFPSMKLIYNGDIDSYDAYCKIEKYFDGVMIGRCMLSNPLIFSQIKNKQKCRSENYDIALNDLSLIHEKGLCFLSDEKKKVISEFVDLCEKENLSKDLVRKNLVYLFKGASDKEFLKECLNLLSDN